ncbi:hypothetical protein AR687_24385 [Flavobacteriaceae bacterium CRH]|nr:hypothetical protein AR687_24385 [Flavobacteriaceae bacterium CRH]
MKKPSKKEKLFGYLSEKNFVQPILRGSFLVYSQTDVRSNIEFKERDEFKNDINYIIYVEKTKSLMGFEPKFPLNIGVFKIWNKTLNSSNDKKACKIYTLQAFQILK